MGSATKSPLPTAAAALPPSVSDTSANDTSVGDRLGSPQVKMAQSPAPVRMASPQAAPVVEKVEERAAAPATPTALQVQRHARDLCPLEWRANFLLIHASLTHASLIHASPSYAPRLCNLFPSSCLPFNLQPPAFSVHSRPCLPPRSRPRSPRAAESRTS